MRVEQATEMFKLTVIEYFQLHMIQYNRVAQIHPKPYTQPYFTWSCQSAFPHCSPGGHSFISFKRFMLLFLCVCVSLSLFVCVNVCLCFCVSCKQMCTRIQVLTDVRSEHWVPWSWSLGGYELCNMGAGNQTLIFCRNNQCFCGISRALQLT